MTLRTLIVVAGLGTAAYALLKRSGVNLPGDLLSPVLAVPGGDFGLDYFQPDPNAAPAATGYTAAVTGAESAGQAYAKNPNSSASGLFQFTQKTWESVGGTWGPDPTQPFGGLTPSVAEQTARFNTLTQANASGLIAKGIAATDGALYAAHLLGLGTALAVLGASPSASLASVVGSKVIAANPTWKAWSVGDFLSWAAGKA